MMRAGKLNILLFIITLGIYSCFSTKIIQYECSNLPLTTITLNRSTDHLIEIISPLYGYGKYPPNSRCGWNFKIKSGNSENIKINCDSFTVKGTVNRHRKCTGDKLSIIYEEEAFHDPNQMETFNDQFCGWNVENGPRDLTYEVAKGSDLNITWFSNSDDETGYGFKCDVYLENFNNKDHHSDHDDDEADDGGIELMEKLETCQCGIKNEISRIVNGKATDKNEYPWHVGIVRTPYFHGDKPFCGGSIISSRHIITAAHCINSLIRADQIHVLISDHDITVENDGEFIAMVSEILVHPKYNRIENNNYDFSIITLKKPLTFNEKIRPICLPDINHNLTYVGFLGTVTGWGRLKEDGNTSPILQETNLKIISNKDCSAKYHNQKITHNMLCTSSPKTDACQGDSGGPLIVPNEKNYELAGVVSWGIGCSREEYPGVFARVSSVLDWIHESMKNVQDLKMCSREGKSIMIYQMDQTDKESEIPQDNDCLCGMKNVAKDRIVGGAETQKNEYPWMVTLAYNPYYPTDEPFCGGTIISKTHIVTAAQCVKIFNNANEVQVIFGEHNVKTHNDGAFMVKVSKISIHPHYKGSFEDDIAILTLVSPLHFTKTVRPICLPGFEEEGGPPNPVGQLGTVTGWGRITEGGKKPHTLQEIHIPIISNEECNHFYQGYVTSTMICTLGQKIDACEGDSGGALIARNGDNYDFIGVSSWGYGCARGYPGVYTKIESHLGWILSVTGKNAKTCHRIFRPHNQRSSAFPNLLLRKKRKRRSNIP